MKYKEKDQHSPTRACEVVGCRESAVSDLMISDDSGRYYICPYHLNEYKKDRHLIRALTSLRGRLK